jgi:hypothetical protein
MRTFLAGFCSPGGPLAKALGILASKLKNQPPSLGANDPPWEFREVGSVHFFSLGMRTFLAGFCAPGGPLASPLHLKHFLRQKRTTYSQIEKEGLALVWGVNKFNQYLEGRHFTLVMDHQLLTHIFHPHKGVPATAAARIQRWAIFLNTYNYTIMYKNTNNHRWLIPFTASRFTGRGL